MASAEQSYRLVSVDNSAHTLMIYLLIIYIDTLTLLPVEHSTNYKYTNIVYSVIMTVEFGINSCRCEWPAINFTSFRHQCRVKVACQTLN